MKYTLDELQTKLEAAEALAADYAELVTQLEDIVAKTRIDLGRAKAFLNNAQIDIAVIHREIARQERKR